MDHWRKTKSHAGICSMQRVEWKKKKKGIAMVMSGVPREKKQRFRRGANLKK